MQSNDNQEIDFSLLRQAKFEDVKVGDVLLTFHISGDIEVKYKNGDITLLEFDDGSADTWTVEDFDCYGFCFKPLCWIEGKPVYKGCVVWNVYGDPSSITVSEVKGSFVSGYCVEGYASTATVTSLSWTKPKKTRMIGDVECPMPEIKELNQGDKYYSVSFAIKDGVITYFWNNDELDIDLLEKGLIFLNREDTEKTAEAIFKLTRI